LPEKLSSLDAAGGVDGNGVLGGIATALGGAALLLAPEVTIPIIICAGVATAAGGFATGYALAQ
jgi:hypothetical protein